MTMKTTLTRIGNSKGLIISSKVLRQCGFLDEVDMEVKGNSIILKPAAMPRKGWENSFRKKGAKEDMLIPDTIGNEWDKDEWQW